MNLAILIIALSIIGLILKPKRDWFVVEIRSCFDDKLIHWAFHPETALLGFDREDLKSVGVKIHVDKDSKPDFVIRRNDESSIVVQQVIFDDANAALIFFERISINNQKLYAETNNIKIYLRRIVARFRSGAATIPPKKYIDKDGELLRQWPEELGTVQEVDKKA